MASDVDYIRLYLFKSLEGCCKNWFTIHNQESCVNDVIQGVYIDKLPCHLNRPDEGPETDADGNALPCEDILPDHANNPDQPIDRTSMWYPDLDGMKCKDDGHMESWMLHDDFVEWYLFNTRQQCCAAFGFC